MTCRHGIDLRTPCVECEIAADAVAPRTITVPPGNPVVFMDGGGRLWTYGEITPTQFIAMGE